MTSGTTNRKIDKLIDLLTRNATIVISGQKIASEIGVTRSTVWDYIQKLRSLGVDIKGHPSNGYQLRKLPDVLVPSLISEELGENAIGRKMVHFFRTDSTNSVALRMAAEGAAHGTVVVAEEQTAGRGRFGRNWYSEKTNGIYVSVILRPSLAPASAPILTLMAGVAAHRALASITGLPLDIRWPNDLLVNGKKVCGILTEMSAEVDQLHYVVIGTGINVNHRALPAALEGIATSLRIEGRKVYSRAQILVALLKELERAYQILLKGGTPAIARAWASVSSFSEGKKIRVVSNSGGYAAVTAGVEPMGALRVRREDGSVESLVSGEILEVK